MPYASSNFQKAESWEKLVIEQWKAYFLAKIDMNTLPRTPEKIVCVYSCLQDMELLAQPKMLGLSPENRMKYKTARITREEIKNIESSGDFTEATNRFHTWALALEPFFRNLRPADKVSLSMKDPAEELETGE